MHVHVHTGIVMYSVIVTLDINECDFKNGNCDQNCKNKLGTYDCSCDEGYVLDADSHSCIGMETLIKLNYKYWVIIIL